MFNVCVESRNSSFFSWVDIEDPSEKVKEMLFDKESYVVTDFENDWNLNFCLVNPVELINFIEEVDLLGLRDEVIAILEVEGTPTYEGGLDDLIERAQECTFYPNTTLFDIVYDDLLEQGIPSEVLFYVDIDKYAEAYYMEYQETSQGVIYLI